MIFPDFILSLHQIHNMGAEIMNSDTLQGQWKQLKGKIREQWGKLTDDDVDKIHGSYEQLIGKIQERYGIAKDAAKKMVDAWDVMARAK